ncbi:4Fe-4S binding protein [Uliginosibacterium gangwonense]|uniref:4Fe-4S binding protein n=1 Tax=Uliginosibacterium gangwonense TaxID=392736 RepID=UPI000A31114E
MKKPEEVSNPPCHLRPFKRSTSLAIWPNSPQADSGHLAFSNKDWRNMWPQIEWQACNSCSLCLLFCPEGAISWNANRLPIVQEDWCKGCGLCARECPKNLIAMIPQTHR